MTPAKVWAGAAPRNLRPRPEPGSGRAARTGGPGRYHRGPRIV